MIEQEEQSFVKDKQWILLMGIVVISIIIVVVGLRRDLPYAVAIDETIYTSIASRMVQERDLNPGWFGNPGSTVIYPLTVAYFFVQKFFPNVPDFYIMPNLLTHVPNGVAPYYYIGRILTFLYTVLTIPLVFLIGRRAFDARVGLLASLFTTFYVVLVSYSQIVRTDNAGMFWGCLSIWFCFLMFDHQTWWSFLFAGLAIGSAIATRYFMVVLIPVFGIVAIYLLWRSYKQSNFKKNFMLMTLGALAIGFGFVIWTPYFFLDFDTVVANILNEARSEHPGADGLTPIQNLWWYISKPILNNLGYLQMIFASIAVICVIWKRKFLPNLLFIYVVLFLCATIISPLHWSRWIIQILPILAIFAAYGLLLLLDFLQHRFMFGHVVYLLLFTAVVIVTMCPSVQNTMRLDYQRAIPSTNVLARAWMLQHLPQQSKIVEERYAAPLADAPFDVIEVSRIYDKSLNTYEQEGVDFLVVSTGAYARFYHEPERYLEQIQFYDELFSERMLIQEFKPSNGQGGDVIRVYKLNN